MEHAATMAVRGPGGQSQGYASDDEVSKQQLVTVLDHIPVGIAILDAPDLRVRFANYYLTKLLDEPYCCGSLVGLRFPDAIPGGFELGLGDWIIQTNRAGGGRRELRIDSQSRGMGYWEVTVTPLPDRGASSPGLMLQVLEITDTVLARAERDRLMALAEQRSEQLVAATESISDGVVLVDTAGKVRRINSTGIAMLDLDLPDPGSDGSVQHEVDHIAAPPRLRIDLPPLHLALRGQTIRNYEHGIQRRDGGTTWLNVSSAPLYDYHGAVCGAVAGFQDIGERKLLDQLKDDFLAVTAHELRTPVTALLGYTNLVVRRAERAEWAERDLHALRMIEAQAGQLTQLINGLLDVSRVQTGALEIRRQPVELHALASRVVDSSRANAVGHTIVVKGPDEPVMVWGDPQRLDQIIGHLLSNALKFSPWGGSVHLQVWTDDADAHIAISDAGIGVPEEAIEQVFERFYRAANVDSDRISGLGVGLYLVKELVVAHGGRIDVRSEPDRGSTFEIALPLYTAGAVDGQGI